MRSLGTPVLGVLGRQGGAMDYQKILGVVPLSSLRVVEGAGDDHLHVEDHDLGFGDGVPVSF